MAWSRKLFARKRSLTSSARSSIAATLGLRAKATTAVFNCTNDAGMSNGDSRTTSNGVSPRHFFDLESVFGSESEFECEGSVGDFSDHTP
jgi:hypothetical protein